jgi:putative transposase
MVAHRESAELAKQLIAISCERQGIEADQLTIHADRGSAMTSKPVALLLSDLGITRTHSRPYVSNDNPYSESQFKTMKYRPEFPDRFGSVWHARSFGGDFFPWYNLDHHHEGLGMYTPHDVHYGLAEARREERATVLAEAYARHPERFPRGMPRPKAVPIAVWINPPANDVAKILLENAPTHGSAHNEIVAVRTSRETENRVIDPRSENLNPGRLIQLPVH